jgi:hypothetical protein
LLNTRVELVRDEVRVNRQDYVIIDFVTPVLASSLDDNSLPDLSSERTANNEEIGTLCIKPMPHQDNP